MTVAPRPKNLPPETALRRLAEAATAVDKARAELKAAIIAASEAGGSIRVLASVGGISTRTVQDWLQE